MDRHFAAGLELGFPFFGNITLRYWIILSDPSRQRSDLVFKGSSFDINPPHLHYCDILSSRGSGIILRSRLCHAGIIPHRNSVVPGCSVRMDRQTWRSYTVAFRNFANVPKSRRHLLNRTSSIRIPAGILTSVTFSLILRRKSKRYSAPLYRHWGSVQAVQPIGGVEV